MALGLLAPPARRSLRFDAGRPAGALPVTRVTATVRPMDARAQRAFFDRYGPIVRRRALSILGNEADAADATQEVFIRALRGLESFGKRSKLSTWLYRITTNYCLNLIRDRARRRELWDEKVAPDLSASTPAGRPAELLALRRALAEADPQHAAAAVYVYVDGLSHREAAGLLGVSKRTVGNLLARFDTHARAIIGETS